MSARVGVVVTTRNSAATLDACLTSIRRQTERELELVVVDNHSSDATLEIARRHADQVIQAGPERSRQRNLGAQVTGAAWLLFVDSDMVLPATCVAECLAESGRGHPALVVPEVSGGEGFWAACKALERACYVGDDSIEAARWISRDLFDELGGFDEELTGEEDWDLTARIRAHGVRIGRTATSILHDEGRLGLGETMRAKFYYGRTMYRYIRKHPRAARSQLRLFRPAFFRNAHLLTEHPGRTAGMFTMKGLEILSGGLGTLAGIWADR